MPSADTEALHFCRDGIIAGRARAGTKATWSARRRAELRKGTMEQIGMLMRHETNSVSLQMIGQFKGPMATRNYLAIRHHCLLSGVLWALCSILTRLVKRRECIRTTLTRKGDVGHRS